MKKNLSYHDNKNFCNKQQSSSDSENNSVVNFICRGKADNDRIAGKKDEIADQQGEENLFVLLVYFRFAHPARQISVAWDPEEPKGRPDKWNKSNIPEFFREKRQNNHWINRHKRELYISYQIFSLYQGSSSFLFSVKKTSVISYSLKKSQNFWMLP